MRARALILTAVVQAGLTSCSPKPTVEPTPHPPPEPPPVAIDAAPEAPPPGLVGAACESARPFEQGTCADGSMCAPIPGGYCMSWCGFGRGCPSEASCVQSHRAGELCLRSCAADADCREGFTCDPVWGVCGMPGQLAPKPPVCPDQVALGARSRFGEATMVSVGEGRGRYSFEPTAALLPGGELVIVYTAMNEQAEDNTLASVVVAPDGSVGDNHVVASGKKRHFDPWLAARGDQVALVWLGHDGGGRDLNAEIGLALSGDGATWTATRAIHDATADCVNNEPYCLDKPMVVARRRGRKRPAELVVTYSGSEATRAIVSDPTQPDEPFSAARSVDTGPYGDLRVDARGVIHMVGVVLPGAETERFGDAGAAISYVKSEDGGVTFSEPVRVNAADEAVPFYFSNAQVVSDPARKRLYVVYPTGGPDTKWDIALATSRDGGRTWTRTRVNDDPTCANHMTPKAELDPKTGKLFVMWTENRGGVGRVVHAVCTAKGTCGPNEAVSDAPFAAYSFVRHSSMWVGEYNALVLDTKRRILHAVWTQPVDEDGVPTSRVFHAAAKL